MAEGPEQTIIESITQPAGRRAVKAQQSPTGWQSAVVTGGPPSTAKFESIAFLKERRAGRRRIYAVTYTDLEGRPHLDFLGVTQHEDGSWTLSGGAGGSGKGPERDLPWMNFAGWWGPGMFAAGGQVIGVGAEQASVVELVFSDGETLRDTADDGLVLFLEERSPKLPATAKILGEQGRLLADHPAF